MYSKEIEESIAKLVQYRDIVKLFLSYVKDVHSTSKTKQVTFMTRKVLHYADKKFGLGQNWRKFSSRLMLILRFLADLGIVKRVGIGKYMIDRDSPLWDIIKHEDVETMFRELLTVCLQRASEIHKS